MLNSDDFGYIFKIWLFYYWYYFKILYFMINRNIVRVINLIKMN